MVNSGFWSQFSILFAAALLGGAAIIPYTSRLLEASHRSGTPELSFALLLLSLLQTAVISAIAIGFGLLAARAIGLGVPYLAAALAGDGSVQAVRRMSTAAIGLGGLTGVIVLSVDLLLLPYWPETLLEKARQTTLWENFTASFYGGINEELLARLFGFSAVAWLLAKIWHTPSGLPTNAVFWTANVIMAVVFALAHLPAARALLGSISPFIVVRTLLLNTPVALICGWLFWNFGFEAAVLAHFSADIVYHIIGTVILQLMYQAKT